MKKIRKLLLPFSLVYALILNLRNYAYHKGWFRSVAFNLPVICVGNLSLGGTGKSPAIEYLVRLLQNNYQLSTLSRGYGRKTKGFKLVQTQHTSEEVGDEPLQFKRKFPTIEVAVDEQRVNGIKQLLQLKKPDVVLLDDAFQHRKLSAGFYILLTVYGDLYADDWVLPAGNLREPASGAKRADVIIITKCPPDLSEKEQQVLLKKLNLKPHQEAFFGYISYATSVFSSNKQIDLNKLKDYTLITGIANPKPLLQHLNKIHPPTKHRAFADHHQFTPKEIAELKKEKCLLTTEKDFVRLKNEIPSEKLFYLPIEMKLLNNAKRFENKILNYVTSASSQITNN